MQQLLNSGKNKYGSNQSSSGSGSGLTGLASQFLSSGSHNSNTGNSNGSSGAAGIVGALAGSLLGGKKPNNQAQNSYSGNAPQQQQSGGGFLGGMFNGHNGSVCASLSCYA